MKRMCPKSDSRDSNPPSSHIKLVQTEKGKSSRWLRDWPWPMERNIGRACSGILSEHWSRGHRPWSIGSLGLQPNRSHVTAARARLPPRAAGWEVRVWVGRGSTCPQSEGHHPSGAGKGSEDFERHLCISICQHLWASTMNSGTVATWGVLIKTLPPPNPEGRRCVRAYGVASGRDRPPGKRAAACSFLQRVRNAAECGVGPSRRASARGFGLLLIGREGGKGRRGDRVVNLSANPGASFTSAAARCLEDQLGAWARVRPADRDPTRVGGLGWGARSAPEPSGPGDFTFAGNRPEAGCPHCSPGCNRVRFSPQEARPRGPSPRA